MYSHVYLLYNHLDVFTKTEVMAFDRNYLHVNNFRINSVSTGQIRGDAYSTGCLGQTGKYRRENNYYIIYYNNIIQHNIHVYSISEK
jgi:hypothetical protein